MLRSSIGLQHPAEIDRTTVKEWSHVARSESPHVAHFRHGAMSDLSPECASNRTSPHRYEGCPLGDQLSARAGHVADMSNPTLMTQNGLSSGTKSARTMQKRQQYENLEELAAFA
jgi:hypothetical protein